MLKYKEDKIRNSYDFRVEATLARINIMRRWIRSCEVGKASGTYTVVYDQARRMNSAV